MKWLIPVLILLAGQMAAQPDPAGATVKMADGVWFFNKVDGSWVADGSHYPDTLVVSTGKWTKPFKARGGYLNLEGVAILGAGTDSFKVVCYGSNSQNPSVTMDTTMLTRLDSTKVLAAGLYNKVFNLSGKFKPWLVLQWVPLNSGASTGAKSRRTSIGMQ